MPKITYKGILRMPAEWEPQKSTWIAWPHNKDDWPGKFDHIPFVFGKIISELSRVQLVNILVKDKSEKNNFCRVVDQYLSILIKLSNKAKPEVDKEIIQERIDFQKNYCVQQMKNEKTSMVLLKYFDEKWVNYYIKTVLFDF